LKGRTIHANKRIIGVRRFDFREAGPGGELGAQVLDLAYELWSGMLRHRDDVHRGFTL
jgi:hypothetical protein